MQWDVLFPRSQHANALQYGSTCNLDVISKVTEYKYKYQLKKLLRYKLKYLVIFLLHYKQKVLLSYFLLLLLLRYVTALPVAPSSSPWLPLLLLFGFYFPSVWFPDSLHVRPSLANVNWWDLSTNQLHHTTKQNTQVYRYVTQVIQVCKTGNTGM